MRFTTTTIFTLSLLAGNVVSAPTAQINDVAVPVEARAADFVGEESARLEARKKAKAAARDIADLEARDEDDDVAAVEI
ncbi:hypothetical protein LZ31DRAFT_601715, partial [Colletotrichum somersetense]